MPKPGKMRRVMLAFALALCAIWPAVRSWGQDDYDYSQYSRSGRFDLYFDYKNLNSANIELHAPIGNIPLTMDNTNMYGFGFGADFYTFGLHFDSLFGRSNLHGGGPADGTERRIFISHNTLDFTWFILGGPFTPFISGGVGWQYLEANLNLQPGVPVYEDPWWGPVYGRGYYPVYRESDFMWTGSAGVRWDITPYLFIKATADSTWPYFRNTSGPTRQMRYGVSLGISAPMFSRYYY
jgi:opacity protein-like surface antigen